MLCGLAIETPVERELDLSEKEREESLNLLQTLSVHWFGERGQTAEIAFDEIFIIGGIGVHKGTAYDWLARGIITQSAIDNARILKLEI